jgi:gamma-glutamyltranspeptidase / glutathione hydrolase
VTDKWGNVVSYTTTIEQVFGTGIMVPGYGLMLNNELTDFDAVPGGANEVQPNKRPLSSMTPTIVFEDDKPVLTVGSPGGPTIITSVLQTILHTIEYDMELKAAVEEPRIYTNNLNSYRFENGISSDLIARLNQMGHRFGTNPVVIGNVQSILIDNEKGTFKGVADSSRNGAAIGVDLKTKKDK